MCVLCQNVRTQGCIGLRPPGRLAEAAGRPAGLVVQQGKKEGRQRGGRMCARVGMPAAGRATLRRRKKNWQGGARQQGRPASQASRAGPAQPSSAGRVHPLLACNSSSSSGRENNTHGEGGRRKLQDLRQGCTPEGPPRRRGGRNKQGERGNEATAGGKPEGRKAQAAGGWDGAVKGTYNWAIGTGKRWEGGVGTGETSRSFVCVFFFLCHFRSINQSNQPSRHLPREGMHAVWCVYVEKGSHIGAGRRCGTHALAWTRARALEEACGLGKASQPSL